MSLNYLLSRPFLREVFDCVTAEIRLDLDSLYETLGISFEHREAIANAVAAQIDKDVTTEYYDIDSHMFQICVSDESREDGMTVEEWGGEIREENDSRIQAAVKT